MVYKEIRENIELPNTQNGFAPLDIINGRQEMQQPQNDQLEQNIGQPINDPLPKYHDDPLPNTQPDPKSRRSAQIKRLAISDDCIVYLEDADIGIKDDLRTFKEAKETEF